MLLKIIFRFSIIFLIQCLPNIGISQMNCDTLFLVKGDVILVKSDPIQIGRIIRYQECNLEKSKKRISIKKEEVSRIGINQIQTSIKKTPKRAFNDSKLRLLDGSIVKGNFLGLKDSSIVMLQKEKSIAEFEVKNIKRIDLSNSDRVFTFAMIGGVVGGTIGGLAASAGSSGSSSGDDLNIAGGILTGTLLGGFVGGLIGSIAIKIEINGNQSNYEKEMAAKIKFKY